MFTHVLLFLRFFSCFEVKENPQAAINLSVCMLVYTPNKTLTLTLAWTHTHTHTSRPWHVLHPTLEKVQRDKRGIHGDEIFLSVCRVWRAWAEQTPFTQHTPPNVTLRHLLTHTPTQHSSSGTYKHIQTLYHIDYNDNPHCVYWHFIRHVFDHIKLI